MIQIEIANNANKIAMNTPRIHNVQLIVFSFEYEFVNYNLFMHYY